MEVFSININKFGGNCPNGRGMVYDSVIAAQVKNIIGDFLETQEDNAVFLNEVNNAKCNLEVFKRLFDKTAYVIHKPSNFEAFNDRSHPYGCTIAVTKRNSVWEEAPSIQLVDRKSGELSYGNKNVILTNGDTILAGVHAPYDTDYWNAIINYYEMHHEKRLYIFGDLNVYDEGTDRKEKFGELKEKGAMDVWLERGGANGHVTCTTGRRLDYLLSSEAGYSSVRKMHYLDSLRTNGLTDHSGILFEIE